MGMDLPVDRNSSMKLVDISLMFLVADGHSREPKQTDSLISLIQESMNLDWGYTIHCHPQMKTMSHPRLFSWIEWRTYTAIQVHAGILGTGWLCLSTTSRPCSALLLLLMEGNRIQSLIIVLIVIILSTYSKHFKFNVRHYYLFYITISIITYSKHYYLILSVYNRY